MNMNVNAYGGYYSGKDFYQKKAGRTASSIDNKELEAVLREKDPELLKEIQGMASDIWNKESDGSGVSAAFRKAADYVYAARKEMGADASGTDKTDKVSNAISAKNEEKLSKKAQKFLDHLRKQYGDYDFLIGNGTDDLKALSKSGSKEFSVIFSNAELERMANDEKYAAEKMHGVEGAVKMCKRICEENGYVSAFGKGEGPNGTINKIGVSFDDHGNTKLFAELEKTSSKQRERIEKSREKKAEDKRHKETVGVKNPYEKDDKNSVKRATIVASSAEELLEKIKNFDWNKVQDSHSGDRFNYTA